MNAGVAVAVCLMAFVMMIAWAKEASQLVHVLVQARPEVCKMTNMAALVMVLVVLAENQMVGNVEVRNVATKLGIHNTIK